MRVTEICQEEESLNRDWVDEGRVARTPGSFDFLCDFLWVAFRRTDGRTLAARVTNAAPGAEELWLWGIEPETGAKRRAVLPGQGGIRLVSPGAFFPDGRKLVTASRWAGFLYVWDAASGRKLHEWTLPGDAITCVFAADGRHLATGNANGTVYILRLPDVGVGDAGR